VCMCVYVCMFIIWVCVCVCVCVHRHIYIHILCNQSSFQCIREFEQERFHEHLLHPMIRFEDENNREVSSKNLNQLHIYYIITTYHIQYNKTIKEFVITQITFNLENENKRERVLFLVIWLIITNRSELNIVYWTSYLFMNKFCTIFTQYIATFH
jgi:hypothetical protein